MSFQLKYALLLLKIYWILVLITTVTATANEKQNENQSKKTLIYGAPIISSEARAARIAEFLSSHKKLDNIQNRKNDRVYESDEDKDRINHGEHERSQYDFENFANQRLLYDEKFLLKSSIDQNSEDKIKNDSHDKDYLLSHIHVSSENPTTMLPLLTTTRDTRSFDFVPVNLIRDEAKENSFSHHNKNFDDVGDISLIPAGSNTRIQVKKGPNGKDYEYEYVYYYYDEEDDGKIGTGATASNSQEILTRTSAPSNLRRSNNANRNKYSTFERMTTTTTAEPIINEVIPSGNNNKARQLEIADGNEEASVERLPTNTRFPPRTRSNHVMETTERASRGRGNRQRTTVHEVIDSSSFRNTNNVHLLQEGPEFPQNLPNGPVRFLGVTPNEGHEEKIPNLSRSRGRPHRISEPAPVQEKYEEPQNLLRKRPIAEQYEIENDYNRGQSQFYLQNNQKTDQDWTNNATIIAVNSSIKNSANYKDIFTELTIDTTDNPTTQVPHAMDKVALDLYAFLQQGRSNLIDFVKEGEETSDSTDTNVNDDSITTELPDTTFSGTDFDDAISPTTSLPTTTTLMSTTINITTSTTTTTPKIIFEEPTTVSPARTKFRRPGIGGSAISRNRFKSNGGTNAPEAGGISTEVAQTIAHPTQRPRGRFGTNTSSGAGSFKRTKPSSQKSATQSSVVLFEESTLQKENNEKVNAETKSLSTRGRYRGGSARSGSQTRTSTMPSINKNITNNSDKPTNFGGPTFHRPNSFNKLGTINRRRGNRPTTSIIGTVTTEEATITEQTSSTISEQENDSHGDTQQQVHRLPAKVSVGVTRVKPLSKPIIKPGAGRLNLRPRAGQQTSTTTEIVIAAVGLSETSIDEPASEGTEEETRETPAETSSAGRLTTANPLNKLRNRNRIQVQPKTTTARTPLPPAARRSHLLPRRKITEAPATESAESITNSGTPDDFSDSTEGQPLQLPHTEAATVAIPTTQKHEENRGLSSLLASRRRLSPRRPGQLIVSSTASIE